MSRETSAKKLGVLIKRAFELARIDGNPMQIDLAQLGLYFKRIDPSFTPQVFGYDKLRLLLQNAQELKVIKDDSVEPPRYFAEYLGGDLNENPISYGANPTIKSGDLPDDLFKFAFVPDAELTNLREKLVLQDNENWGQDNNLIRNYIIFTYMRLVRERKVLISGNKKFAAFNTGLVDKRYQAIYALFEPNNNDNNPWKLTGFCTAREGLRGRMLSSNFIVLPDAAYFFNDPWDAIYNINTPKPEINWVHVLKDNVDRLPTTFIKRYMPTFDVKSCKGMSEEELEKYKKDFESALDSDIQSERDIMARFDDALETALKRVRWNYKTAIPVYFAAKDQMSMLLPLCLENDKKVSCALVLERIEVSGMQKYLANTIYSIEMAYKNARLITRPDSDWLQGTVVEKVSTDNKLAMEDLSQ